LLDKLLDRDARPQGKRKLQLVGTAIFYRSLKLALLIFSQCATSTFAATPLFVFDRFLTALLVGLPPFANIRVVNANDRTDFLVRPSGLRSLMAWLRSSCCTSGFSFRVSVFSIHDAIA
jgi:hypothetical protein